jgi:hypothetical protein
VEEVDHTRVDFLEKVFKLVSVEGLFEVVVVLEMVLVVKGHPHGKLLW